jgi:CHRD domain
MTAQRTRFAAALAGLVLIGTSAGAAAGSGNGGDDHRKADAVLVGYEEVPAISTEGGGSFRARMSGPDAFTFRLSYGDLSSPVQQAHIHFGQRSVNGGVAVFLCSNLGNGPAGTAVCPDAGEVTGTITAAQVVGPTGQGIAPGEFAEVLEAIRAGVAYVNVHTDTFPTGEIRGQLGRGDHRHHDHD